MTARSSITVKPARSAGVPLFLLAVPFALGAGTSPLNAVGPSSFNQSPIPNPVTVILVTVDPGRALATRFGHSALWIRDGRTGEERAYAFGQSNLWHRGLARNLLRGRAEVGGGEIELEAMLRRYREQGRRIHLQTLNLTSPDPRTLEAILRRESGPFRYDLFRSNCTTRIRDALDQATGGQLRSWAAEAKGRESYRDLVRPYSDQHPVLLAAEGLLLTADADRVRTRWEALFLPTKLREGVREVTVLDASGRETPLVVEEEIWPAETGTGRRNVLLGAPSGTLLLPLGALLGAALAWSGGAGSREEPAGRLFLFLAGGWSLTSGLLGLWLFLVTVSSPPPFGGWNENLLQFSPLPLFLAVVLSGSGRDLERARLLTLGIVAFSLAGLTAKALPGFDQANPFVLAFAVPVHLGLALGVSRWVGSTRSSEGGLTYSTIGRAP